MKKKHILGRKSKQIYIRGFSPLLLMKNHRLNSGFASLGIPCFLPRFNNTIQKGGGKKWKKIYFQKELEIKKLNL